MKKFMFPQEIEVWYVLPAIRRAFTMELISSGMNQKKIAKALEITEAAVSQYKNEKRAHNEFFDSGLKGAIKESAKRIAEKQSNSFTELMRINNLVRKTGVLCKIHRSLSDVPKGCERVCESHYFPDEIVRVKI